MLQQQSPAFSFSQPGVATGDPSEFGAYRVEATSPKKLGLVPMLPDSRHVLSFKSGDGRAKQAQVTCKDRRNFHRANVRIYCMHPTCAGKSWGSVREMADVHPPHLDMVNRGEVHLFFAWSEDPCNPPDASCNDCKAATGAASKRATAAAREANKDAPEVRVDVPCKAHAGGVIGLLTPHDPNLPDAAAA